MTKIPSVEERLSIYKVPCDCPKGGLVGDAELPCEKCDGSEWMIPENITQALTAERTALLTELRDSGLLEEKGGPTLSGYPIGLVDGHNKTVRAIKAHINSLINPTIV